MDESSAYAWAAEGAGNVVNAPMALTQKVADEIEGPRGFQLGDFIQQGTWENVKNGKPKKIRNVRTIDNIDPPEKKEEQVIQEINVQGLWEVVPVKLDSGAFDWVFNPKTAQAFELKETESSKAGLHYSAANGSTI